jgi:hypothetical protein
MMSLPDNTTEEYNRMKALVQNWKVVGPILEEMRREDIRSMSEVPCPEAFAGLMAAVVKSNPPSNSSGLVEQQRWFLRWKKW